jgi:arylformamidase
MSEPSCLIDITLPISERLPVWPGDAPVEIHRTTHVVTISEFRMSSHVGTHLDAPAHFLATGRTVDQVPLEALIGPAWLVDTGEAKLVTAETLDRAGIPSSVERLLVKTMNSRLGALKVAAGPARPAGSQERAPFDEGFVALDSSAARWLLDHRVRLVGIDAPSIEPFKSTDFAVHRLLLGSDLVIVENLLLQNVASGAYRLICLPLPYEGGDGAPVRAVLESK